MCQTGLRSVRVGKDCKRIHVGYFVDERACADAVVAKRVEVEASIAAKLRAMAQELVWRRRRQGERSDEGQSAAGGGA